MAVVEDATAMALLLWYFPTELNESKEIPRLQREGNWEAEEPVGDLEVN